MGHIDQYLSAATRNNTRRSYQSAVQHFEVTWGGFLPASSDSIARYLVNYAPTLAVNTLRQRLAAIAQWHIDQGFPDPTKAPLVKKVLKGIQALHPAQEKRAKPFQIEQLEQLDDWLEQQIAIAASSGNAVALLKHRRDRALVLVGFWRGFRSDELSRVSVENIDVVPGEGMILFLSQTKGDRHYAGTTLKAPALSRLCPVAAYQAWIEAAGLKNGAVFRRIDRWGHIGSAALHTNSFIPLLRELFQAAQIPAPDSYSSHSLRHGFASWANANRWDLKMLMEYVGWKDAKSAMRYIEAPDPFGRQRIEAALSQGTAQLLLSGEPVPRLETALELQLSIERYSKFVRGMKKARETIERVCLRPYAMRRKDKDSGRYGLTVAYDSPEQLDAMIRDLLIEVQQIADSHHCFVEAAVQDPRTGRRWD